MSANAIVATLGNKLDDHDTQLEKLGNAVFVLGKQKAELENQIGTLQSNAVANEALLLRAEAAITRKDPPLPPYTPVLTGPTAQVVSASVGKYVKIGNIVYFTAQISWSTPPSGGSGWTINAPVQALSSAPLQAAFSGYTYGTGAGTGELVAQIAPGTSVFSTLTPGWGAGGGVGGWVGAGLVGAYSNITFMGWYLCD